ncbi:hypothetical protein JF50_03870 [Pseudoalteromonas luteoviolacea]|uniref:Uncharacterized protein n=1 Tax=Pseudoalteromonas luteoviolacea TaxID=43657 RepID=A0A0C1QEY5_9GAMM|nr:NAD(P)-dependent oxidoreductase [Pseudoalteromonas luteoviolacea]KID57895.1 hypothetical protein JF50_03870 [Pseudoalteromonas luteoviolacea]
MKKLLVTGDVDITQLTQLDCQICHLKEPKDEQQIIDALVDSHYYIIGGPEHCSAQFLSAAQVLELVVVLGTGTSSFIDLKAASESGVKVMNTPKLNAQTVAQFAFATMIMRNTRFHFSWQKMQAGTWFQTPYKELAGSKIGLIGLGNINRSLLTLIRTVSDQPVYYHARSPKEVLHDTHRLEFLALPELMSTCDLVVVSVTFNETTESLIDENVLANANQELDLLCFSSPHVICPTALRNALTTKTIRSAYMDGYYQEWLDTPGVANDQYGLLSLEPSVFMATTHIAAQSREAIQALLAKAVDNIKQHERSRHGRV